MTSRFDIVVRITLAHEGGFADRDLKDDPGGPTNFGITQATLSSFRGRRASKRDVERLTTAEARQIYKAMFWDTIGGDSLPPGLDLAVFDFGTHSGPGRAVRFLQKIVGCKADGRVGPVTLRLVRAAPTATLIDALCDQRVAFVRRLKNFKANPGWLPRIGKVRAQALAMVGAKPIVMDEAVGRDFDANPRHKHLPRERPKLSAFEVRTIVEAHRHLLPQGFRHAGVVALFLRGYYSRTFGKAGNDRGVYDDAAFLVTPDQVVPFNGNTDPSVYRRRVATLKAPQGILYVKGKHGIRRGGGYDAWRQASNVTVVRDQIGEDRDSAARRFWCNLHDGGTRGTSSLGCLTIFGGQWPEFRALSYQATGEHRQNRLPVILIDNADAQLVPTPDIPSPSKRPEIAPAQPSEDSSMSEEKKLWFKSKGVIGSLGAILTPLLGILGYSISGADIQEAVSLGTALLTSISGLLALIGRITASKKVG